MIGSLIDNVLRQYGLRYSDFRRSANAAISNVFIVDIGLVGTAGNQLPEFHGLFNPLQSSRHPYFSQYTDARTTGLFSLSTINV